MAIITSVLSIRDFKLSLPYVSELIFLRARTGAN
jgi:hypothetical protein